MILSASSSSISSLDRFRPEPDPSCLTLCSRDVKVVGLMCPFGASSSSDSFADLIVGTRNLEYVAFFGIGTSLSERRGERDASDSADVESSLVSIGGASHAGSGWGRRSSFADDGKISSKCP